jgi:thioredoxin 1
MLARRSMGLIGLWLLCTAAWATAPAAPLPYDEAADAKAQLAQALATARARQQRVLVVFGANWCEDCRALDTAVKSPRTAALLARSFVLVKVDVGRFDRNLDITQQYGQPTKRGIPAAVVLSPDNTVLYATRAGELSNARRMSDTGVYDFFQGVIGAEPARP